MVVDVRILMYRDMLRYIQRHHFMYTTQDSAAPGVWTLLRIWAGIGLQSFGGGASTQLLIWREFVDKRAWIGADEMGRFWSLCQLTPGINLVALTILIGRKLGGPWGIVVSLAGMLLPSATATCFLAAGFEVVQHSPVIHAVLRGVIPATAGIMAIVAVNFAQPLIRRARKEGLHSLSISGGLMLISALALIVLKFSIILVLVGVAVLGMVIFTPWRAPVPSPATSGPSQEDQT